MIYVGISIRLFEAAQHVGSHQITCDGHCGGERHISSGRLSIRTLNNSQKATKSCEPRVVQVILQYQHPHDTLLADIARRLLLFRYSFS